MSSLPGILGLVFFLYARPHEFFKELEDYNFLYVFLVIALIGIAHDVSERRTKLTKGPMLLPALLFSGWCVVSLVVRRPDIVTTQAVTAMVGLLLYLLPAHGIQRLGGFYKLCVLIFSLGLFVGYVGADQGLSPFECAYYDPGARGGRAYPNGIECQMVEEDGVTPHDGVGDCIAKSTGQRSTRFLCERAGLFGTTSVGGGRVRYLGVLLDPNELALATALTVPFAFAFVEVRASVFRIALLLFTLGVIAVEIVFTQSRGGLVAYASVLGAYFIKKFGWKRGVIVGAVMSLPLLVLGGREGNDTHESTIERLGCAAAGIKMLMSFPISGVGYSLYADYHFLTAHNAYILAAGELGVPGLWLFGMMMYLAWKIPITVMRHEMPPTHDAKVIKAIAMALLAAFTGAGVGIFFLSWTYHYVLWIHFGLAGSLYAVTKRSFPEYECPFTWKEARNVLLVYLAGIVVWSGYIRYRGAWDAG